MQSQLSRLKTYFAGVIHRELAGRSAGGDRANRRRRAASARSAPPSDLFSKPSQAQRWRPGAPARGGQVRPPAPNPLQPVALLCLLDPQRRSPAEDLAVDDACRLGRSGWMCLTTMTAPRRPGPRPPARLGDGQGAPVVVIGLVSSAGVAP
jgi:hypothetical protein